MTTTVWQPARAVGHARQTLVLVDRGRRHCAYRGIGGARVYQTRRGRALADRVTISVEESSDDCKPNKVCHAFWQF